MTQRGSKQDPKPELGQQTADLEAESKLLSQVGFLASGGSRVPKTAKALRLLGTKSRNGRDAFAQMVQNEARSPDVFCWVPVFMSLGILGYFSMAREPSGLALVLLLTVLMVTTWCLRRTDYALRIALAATLLIAGVTLAKWQTERTATPLLSAAGTFQLSGRVADIVPGEQRSRLVLRDATDLSSDPIALAGVQLSAFNQHITDLQIGDQVWARARLEPLSGPLIPNGYDFRRIGYFNGLSARGFLLGEAIPELNFNADHRKSAADWLTGFRKSISERLKDALPGEAGALASALLVGMRSGISDTTEQALRHSGLAHILAISGLHMALVTALLFGTIRLAASFARTVSARYQVKKWAAAAALLGALGYLALSGAGISAQRAFLMAAVFLVAIMFNRAALTMRNVALEAIFILVFQPSAVLTPGFQMSFMAVIALVAVYRRDGVFSRIQDRAGGMGMVKSMATGTAGLALTSIVAGFATAPFAVHHFYQFAVYGLAGNLAAMPLVGFLVMPSGILALLLLPFGLEWMPLGLMELGLDGVRTVAQHVSSWEGAVSIPGQQPALRAILLGLALICLCLLRTKLRFVAAVMLAFSAFAVNAGTHQSPVLLVSQDGKMMAEVTPDGLEFRGTSRNSFVAGIWMRALGDGRDVEMVLKQDHNGQACDRTGCLFEIETHAEERLQVATINRVEAMFEACMGNASLIISSLYTTPPCPLQPTTQKVIIDKSFLAARGSVVLSAVNRASATNYPIQDSVSKGLYELGLKIETSLPVRKRHWN
ncbi:ComEC/Rec2 family competence protein [Pararhizobium sp. IMCC21322]|uniref:ComEC/Rec2 family competence protein n=1 Tax=Pararhizobium sp. IMCC21322 TaxID=3067903 RepID=UPI0027420638|nr:ComEC/Rec2 family competence protein [Pararhizobium sp. IMCC21322]